MSVSGASRQWRMEEMEAVLVHYFVLYLEEMFFLRDRPWLFVVVTVAVIESENGESTFSVHCQIDWHL